MPPFEAPLHRLAIFTCSVTGCSRTFKSESSLKRHQTNKHVVPEALRPRRRPNADTQDANSDPNDADTQHPDTHTLPHYKTADGFDVERHPILDGERDPPLLAMSAIHMSPQEHHAMQQEMILNQAHLHHHMMTTLRTITHRFKAVLSLSLQSCCLLRKRCPLARSINYSTFFRLYTACNPCSQVLKSCMH